MELLLYLLALVIFVIFLGFTMFVLAVAFDCILRRFHAR